MSDPIPSREEPRPAQAAVLTYTGGPMGISAVPGSGKTFTLSRLAAQLVERVAGVGDLDEREVLVVTFTNSAVANFRARIGKSLNEAGKLPNVGYRVRTLHGLAHDIVRERPGLAGLSEDFDIIDDRTAADIKREAVQAYLRENPDAFAPYLKPESVQNARRTAYALEEDCVDLANTFIRLAKELGATPPELARKLHNQSGTWPLLEFGLRIYTVYQRSLLVRGAVDFDDLILLALQALQADPGYLDRLQDRWPYVLEDEAQDSSLAQEKMLHLLTSRSGNWVRVGDPNQAINTTFTSADTRFLQQFLDAHPDQARNLPNSGRSVLPIIDAANDLIDWSRTQHPHLPPTLALTLPHIEPTAPGDTQGNPPAGEKPVYLHAAALTPDKEVEMVVRSVARWLPEHSSQTVAILAPENARGMAFASALQRAGLPVDDSLLRTDGNTRQAAQALAAVLAVIAGPLQSARLEELWRTVWYPRRARPVLEAATAEPEALALAPADVPGQGPAVRPQPIDAFGESLRRLAATEAFLFPQHADWLDSVLTADAVPGLRALATAFRGDLQRWLRAAVLPIDELVLTLGSDLFTEKTDLALAHRLAVLLAKLRNENPTWRLPELAGELEAVAQNKRRLLGFAEEAQGYVAKPGVITVATMHQAKGLEWDRVYLTAANRYSFPGGGADDEYRSERWYVRDRLNLGAELEAQVRQLHGGTLDDYQPGTATAEARLDLAAERLRLFYVAVTRARCELIVTYNTGRKHEQNPLQPALAFAALQQKP